MGHCCGTLLWDSLPAPQILRVLKLYYKVASSQLPAPQILHVLQLYYKVASSQLPAPPDKSHSRLHFAHSTRTISAEGCARMGQIALSPAFRALDTHDLRRGLRAHGTNRTLACIWCTRHARSPQRVARQVSKTSVSYETSSKTHTSKSVKRAFRTRLPPKVKRKHPSEHTHTSRSPAKQFRDSSPSKQHPLTRQSQWDSDIHLYHNSQPHDSLRLPRIFPHPHV